VIDPASDRVTAQVPVGIRPEGIAYGAGSLWVANLDDDTVQHVDPVTGRVVRTLYVGDTPTSIAASSRAVWVVGSSPNRSSLSVRRIDPRFDAVATVTRIPDAVTGTGGSVATRGNALWVAPFYGLLSRLDARTSRVVETIDPGAGLAALAVGPDAVWFTDSEANTVTRVDPSGYLSPIAVRGRPSAIAAGAGAVWVAAFDDDAVVRIDPRTREVTKTIPVGAAPGGIAVGAGSVWVANSRDGTVTRIDPVTSTVAKTIQVGGSPRRIVVAAERVWVTVQPEAVGETESAVQDGTARLVEGRDPNEIEGGGVYPANDPQLAYATCAKLLDYPDTPAPEGSRLVPEVAASLPTVSSDGTTYTFTIRKGFRFSPPSNEPVTARTVKYSLEWALDPRRQTDARPYYEDIVGAKAYMAGNAAHIAGVLARGNTLTIRLVAPAPDFPSRVAIPYTCAVPVGTPLDPKGLVPIPMAGPYYVSSYTPGQQLVLERNPNYGGSRPQRLARIEVNFGVSERERVAEVEAGSADYALGAVTVQPAAIARLAASYGSRSPAAKDGGQRFFQHPQLRLRFFFLNTHRLPFQNVRVRRAVNYAIDRRALARIPVQEGALVPTDQYLPPGIPGFRDAHVYPFTPDLVEARPLAGGAKRSAVLYTCNEAPCDRIANIVKRNLRAIGIYVVVKRLTWPALWNSYFDDNPGFDLALASWGSFYPDPVESLGPFVGPRAVGDPGRERGPLATAARLPFGSSRDVAYAKIDADLSRIVAPWVPYANSLSADFFSERMGCQVYNPVYGIDLAALCIKTR
jgi:peptide/nickel transport system substrate-binding protein